MNKQFNFDVFLSHSSKDKPIVKAIAERLKSDGLRIWFDEWEIKPGDSIPAKIEEGLECSRVMVLCMSSNAFGSDWTQLEHGTFRFNDPLNNSRRLIPIRLDETPIKNSLKQFYYINWLEPNREQDYEKLFEACRASKNVMKGNKKSKQNSDLELNQSASRCVPELTPNSVRDIWSGLRGIIEQTYSTKIIKGMLGKAGLPISSIEYRGTYKGPVLDEVDKIVGSLSVKEKNDFVQSLIEEILEHENEKSEDFANPDYISDNSIVINLSRVLSRLSCDFQDHNPSHSNQENGIFDHIMTSTALNDEVIINLYSKLKPEDLL